MNIKELTKDFDLTVLLPALNEEESLEKIIDEINYILRKLTFWFKFLFCLHINIF